MKKTLIGIALFIGGSISTALSCLIPNGEGAYLGYPFLTLGLIGLIIMIVEFFIPEKKKEKKADETANKEN